MATLTGGAFVGRQREMGELKTALEDALSGQGRLVMLAGEPGIGKTRLAQEVADYAQQRGVRALWGRCHSSQGAPSYWPWLQILRSHMQDLSVQRLYAEIGEGAAAIAEVIPEVKEQFPDLKSPPALEPHQARFRLFDSITRFLRMSSQAQPLMLVLDNLHWADQSSLQLLEFLAQELIESHLLVVGTFRDTELTPRHPLTQTLGELCREPSFQLANGPL
jgi:eukaryotic-like serine/threonine-protein kinase